MADNVAITAGSGTSVATDDVSGVHYQRVKLDGGGDGAALPLAGATGAPHPTDAGLVVREAGQATWSDGFSGAITNGINANWTELRCSGSMTRNQTSSNLVIVAGTTVNSEFLARTTVAFDGAWAARLRHTMSQRIGNQNFMFLLADKLGDALAATWTTTVLTVTQTAHGFTSANVGQSVCVGGIINNSGTGIPGRYPIASVPDANTYTLTVAGYTAGSGTVNVFGHNMFRANYLGGTATTFQFECASKGWSEGTQTLTTNTTASPGHILQIMAQGRDCYIADALVASSTAPAWTARGSRYEFIPDPTVQLYLYIWAYNATSAPASSTTWNIGQVTVETFSQQPVQISGARQVGAAAPIPVSTVGPVSTSPAASSVLMGDVSQQYRPGSTGGALIKHVVSQATTNATQVKASAGKLLGWCLMNTVASQRFMKIHNTAGTPTPGSAVAQTIPIPPNGMTQLVLEGGIAYSTGIGYSIVAGVGDADTIAVGANDIIGDLFYV